MERKGRRMEGGGQQENTQGLLTVNASLVISFFRLLYTQFLCVSMCTCRLPCVILISKTLIDKAI